MTAAVADNAAWCESVARSLERSVSRTPTVWAVSEPPRWYPHRITLTAGVEATDAVAGLPEGTDSWVKDSYGDVELGEHGFTPVVHASWLHRPAGASVPSTDWSPVESAEELAGWARASGTAGVITTSLLADPGVRLVRLCEGARVVAGAALSCGTEVIGVSNVFADGPVALETWREVTAVAAHLFPGRDLVGYEHGEDLTAALRAGFSSIGALRVWHRPARPSEVAHHADRPHSV